MLWPVTETRQNGDANPLVLSPSCSDPYVVLSSSPLAPRIFRREIRPLFSPTMRAFARSLAKLRVSRVAVPALSASAAATCLFGAASSTAAPFSSTSGVYEGSYSYSAKPNRADEGKPLALPKPQVIFVLGGPGAGKGTQCTRLVKEYGYVHLSAGDLLREERQRGGPEAEMIESYIREGKIVPVEVTVNLIRKAMEKAAPGGGGHFLVDGFPRNFDNLEGWTRVMGEKAEVQGVLFYECPEAVMEKRLIKRGETSGRSDDTADVIRKRFHTYLSSTMPVVNHYAGQGKVFSVNSDQGVDAVFEQTQKLLEPLLAAEVSKCHQLLLDSVHQGDWELYTALSDPELTAVEGEL